MTTTLLSISRQSSELDDQSDGGFEFAHPLFAGSTTPMTAHRTLLQGRADRHSPNDGHANAEHKVAFITPPQTVLTRFGKRQTIGHRTISNDGLATETPGFVGHANHKPTASIPRWKRTGRIGLGPPKRAERQSLDPEQDTSEREDDNHMNKENHPPRDVSRSSKTTNNSFMPNRDSLPKTRNSASPENTSDNQLNYETPNSRPASAASGRIPFAELSVLHQRPESVNSQRPASHRRKSSNSTAYTDRHSGHSKDTSASSHDNALPKAQIRPATPPRTAALDKPEPAVLSQMAFNSALPNDRPLPLLHLSSRPTPVAREVVQAPPPKMTLEANASTAARKAKTLGRIVMNGREYTKLDQIGKGGSSKVFRVMAPNGRIFALKRVDFEQADQPTIQGYKSEIDLLRRLSDSTGCERIIKLYDAEINDSKGRLLMLMEAGEIDLAHMLTKRSAEVPDFNFIRLFWRHMLEAVQAVHEQKIVHSDLKPANFLLVEGSLKLIDFGIAKAIGNDTTNIHRDQQVGTINYMSPEALSDTGSNGARMMKLGRASDVWSLGCILYQMVYGRTPFAHLSMIQKIQAIPSEAHRIDFPVKAFPPSMANDKVKEESMGRVVEGDILRVLRGCLERDQRQRLTIEQLLRDPFLRPEERAHRPEQKGSVAVNLAQITELLRLAVSQTREKTLKKEIIHGSDIEYLAKDFYDRLRWAA